MQFEEITLNIITLGAKRFDNVYIYSKVRNAKNRVVEALAPISVSYFPRN